MKKLFFILFVLVSCTQNLDYPDTFKDRVNYNVFGTTILDPYFYMEEFQSDEVVSWSNKQNELTEKYLESSDFVNIQNKLTQAFSSEYFSMSYFNKKSETYFYNSGREQHNLFILKGDESEVLLDPNKWSEDQTINLDKAVISPNKQFLAYSVSDGGVDWRTIKIIDLQTNEKIAEINEVKFSEIKWSADSTKIFYNKYPKPAPSKRLSQQSYNAALYYFDLSTLDENLFFGEINKEENYTVSFIGEEEEILIKVITGSEEENFYLYGSTTETLEVITPMNKASFNYVHSDEEGLFFITNYEAPNYRLVKVSRKDFELSEIIPEDKLALKNVSFVSNLIIADYIDFDMNSKIKAFDLDGSKNDFSIPENIHGTISGFQESEENKILFRATSYTKPQSYYEYDLVTSEVKVIWQEEIPGYNPDEFIEISTYYTSKDGTQIPLTYSYKVSTQVNGTTPVFLYGYGGYNISIRPSFTPKYVAWLELGGVFAVANIRGGGEFGKSWHDAGRLDNKQNVFDDFLYASKYLEVQNIGNRKSTVISGRSNGGLLVGATLIQNPDYFGATLPAVGVLDMLRFTEFTEGWGWRGDYGSPLINEYDFIRNLKISPYHQIKVDECYSPTLTTTGRRDDRVVPSHSYKFTARLQEYQGCENPILLYDTPRAGHGSGNGVAMPKWKRIKLFSIEQAFALKHVKS